MSVSEKDVVYIQRALELAKQGQGKTSPNPNVGCVIVKDGHVIGEGYHEQYGSVHAEVAAIESATESVEGATLYCNLEPCCNGIPNKKTPPCTNRIIKEKIKKVVIATPDPNPYVNGRGIEELKKAGIEVVTGIEAEKAYRLNESYFKFMRTSIPFVHLKIAQTVDGRIATRTGDSKWITSSSALREVHRLRYNSDAILVGLNTIIQDNPFLTQRLYPGKQPLRIILDEKLKIPLDVNVLNDEYVDKTIIVTTPSHVKKNRKILEKEIGAKVLVVDENENHQVDLFNMLQELAKIPVTNILVEGGSRVFTSFIKEKLADKITFFIAPKMIGTGINSIADLGVEQLGEAFLFKTASIRELDGQVVWTLYPGE